MLMCSPQQVMRPLVVAAQLSNGTDSTGH